MPDKEVVLRTPRGILGQVGFEPTANRLKAEYSTTELLTHLCKTIVLGLCIEYKFLLHADDAMLSPWLSDYFNLYEVQSFDL